VYASEVYTSTGTIYITDPDTEKQMSIRYDPQNLTSFLTNEEQSEIVEETIAQIWEADNEDDLIEEITCAAGWCIKSIDYRHILS
jgi:mannosyltransferase OCH1-like enzyme